MPNYLDNGLHADSDFERIIQPYSDNDINEMIAAYKTSSAECVIYAWGDTLLMSAYLYQRLMDAGLPVKIEQLAFDSKLEAICFVCLQQLERKDLTDSYHRYLIGKAYMAEHILASADQPISKFKSAMKLAGPLNIASGTVLKYYEYTKAIETVYEIEPKLADLILLEAVRISHDNTVELSRIPKENLKRLLAAIESGELKWITYADMRYETHYNPPKGLKPSRVERNEAIDEKLAIRQMPAYDPDAQVSSLALTIPSWSSSIKRVTEATDFSKISNAARNRLMRNLTHLCSSIDTIRKAIEEE